MLVLATERHFGVAPYRQSGLYQSNQQVFRLLEVDSKHGDPTTPAERIHRLQYVFEWPQVIEIAAVEPWPAFRIEWRHNRVVDHRRFEPRRSWFAAEPNQAELDWDRVIVALFDRIEELRIDVPVTRGWASAEHVRWVEDDEWPSEHEELGAYRTTAQRHILATRSKPSPTEFLLSWMVSRQRWRATPREVVVTRNHVYARLAGRRTARVPLGALRTRRGNEGEDAIYVFGRRTMLVLPHREGCEVRRVLDRRLGLGTGLDGTGLDGTGLETTTEKQV